MKNNLFKNKTIGIQQPFFFPYLEYFALINATDFWVVFDTPQFVTRAWFNRNRILNPNKSFNYITVPVHKHKLKVPTNLVKIHTNQPWKSKIISQLGPYKKSAPNYKKVIDFLKESFKSDFEYLSELNTHTLRETCSYLGIDFKYRVFSKMGLSVEEPNGADEWGLNICRAMGAEKYINAITGQKFIDKEKYTAGGIDLKFLKYRFQPYRQMGKPFEPGLSIIDAMMYNSPEEIREMLKNYQLV